MADSKADITNVGVGLVAVGGFMFGMAFSVAYFAPDQFRLPVSWGTLGEWVGGLGAFAAAWAALHVAGEPKREAARTKRMRARVLAFALFAEVALVHKVLQQATRSGMLKRCAKQPDAASLQRVGRTFGDIGLPTVESRLSSLVDLPDEVADVIASVIPLVRLIGLEAAQVSGLGDTTIERERSAAKLKSLRVNVARVRRRLNWARRALVAVMDQTPLPKRGFSP